MSSEERQARSLALEKAYVHDVYDQIAPHFTDTRYRAWPRVKQFLLDLEPASLVADVGCGNGKYLDVNRDVMKIGSDRCAALTAAARAKKHEVVTCDNLQLPFRDETFDAALSVAVIHHFATTDRRVTALKELARVLRIGGKVLITVWAMEQRHRKFDSQDVLVPWHEPVKSSSEDRASSVERELTSTTTSDDDVLVYHAYSHISDSEAGNRAQAGGSGSNVNRRRQKFRNGRGRYRSAGSFDHGNAGGNSRSSSELSSPNETCYSFVKRALQKLSSSTSSNTPYHSSNKPSVRPYFYRSCRKPWVSTSMEFGPNLDVPDADSSRNELYHQSSIESECPDQPNEDDVPIELRHLEGYEPCTNCGSPVREADGLNRCETHVCASCLPIDTDNSGKKSRSLGDFLNMIPKLLRVKKCEKEPLSDLHKRISTASDPREYVVKSRGSNVNGIVRSKSTVSFMSRLEEIMSFSMSSDKNELEESNCAETSISKGKTSRIPSLTATTLVDSDCPVILPEADRSTNPRRYNSPADALRKLRQDVSLDGPEVVHNEKLNNLQQNVERNLSQDTITDNFKLPPEEPIKTVVKLDPSKKDSPRKEAELAGEEPQSREQEQENSQESHLSSYYSMPELYKLTEEQVPCNPIYPAQRQRHISFYEQAQTIMRDTVSADKSNEINTASHQVSECNIREGSCVNLTTQRVLVKRSLSVDTGDNSSSSHQCPRRFSASAAQGVLASALRTYSLPRSSSRGSSVKSDTSIDSEESIVSVIPRKGNSITSDTSVDSEESVISVIQRSTSEIETLVRESGLRNNISRLGSRSARASPVTVLSSQTSSAESSPPQSGKNDGKFPGSGAVIDQLVQQQQQMSLYSLEGVHLRQDSSDYIQRTRRSLLRPISDPKIEDRFFSNSFDESCSTYRSSSRQAPSSNRSSLESDDQVIKEEDEKCCEALGNVGEIKSCPSSEERNSDNCPATTEELSRTPSPIGPFKYIFDSLLNDVDSALLDGKGRQDLNISSTSQKDTKLYQDETNEDASNECQETEKSTNDTVKTQDEGIDELPNEEFQVEEEPYVNATDDENRSKSTSSNTSESALAQVEVTRTSTEAERHEKLRKLSQRLENLGLSSELLKSFYMSSEDNEETFDDNTQSACNESQSAEVAEDSPQEGDELQSDSLCTESVQEKSDEDSAIDESLRTVIHDVKNPNMPKELSEENIPNCDSAESNTPERSHAASSLNIERESVVSEAVASTAKTSSQNCMDNNCEQKMSTRSDFRKRLKRSCVTIDEVECREVASSEDTSPSSSTSLEWNDFDKVEATEIGQAAASTSREANRIPNLTNVRPREEDTTSPEDVNVAETEHKFNVFLDKEICVFFETPSSSIGKSASSSSNATDFSTTSDRIRGVMQREKSDDRSSKESDSDNLSKLSDLEPKSDSAFSEDFGRRTDLEVYSSDAMESHRSKIDSPQSWGECEGGPSTSSASKAWVLDNIDEIPDDDEKPCNSVRRAKPKIYRDWSGEDKSMDFVQKREGFFASAADCRDMYRMSLRNSRDESSESINCVHEAAAVVAASGMVPENPRVVVQESTNKDSDDSEVPTDILAAFVETISDLTSVFGELYPRHEGKFEDVSSDDSLEISSFERILTSQEPQPLPDQQEEKQEESLDKTDKWFSKKETAQSADAVSQVFVNMPEENVNDDMRKVSNRDKTGNNSLANGPVDHLKTNDYHPKLTRHQRVYQDTKSSSNEQRESDDISTKTDFCKTKSEDRVKPEKPSKKVVENLDLSRKATAKPKLLNRSSQSVCTDKFRHDSVEEESSASKTQSAPCSPRLKPRQRSVEEVLSNSKADLSRNSSLSQSTSQESLPGNESGGLMAYHRYYHVFRQGELDNLIENYVENLHIIASYYDHANWCVVAEKVQVWTI